MEFVVMIVETPEQARFLENIFREVDNKRIYFRALAVGQAAVGWQHKGTRPTKVIVAYRELTTDREGNSREQKKPCTQSCACGNGVNIK